MMVRGDGRNREEGVSVRIVENVEDEELDVLKWWATLAFSWHSFGQYQIEVLVEILDRTRCQLIGILKVDDDIRMLNWLLKHSD